jgi:hypothetical protein
VSGGKVKLWKLTTGEAVEVWPVDAREILRGGEYSMSPLPAVATAPDGDPGGATEAPTPLLIDGVSPAGLSVLVAEGETTESLLELESVSADLEAFQSLSREDQVALEAWHRVGRERSVRVETKKAAAGAPRKPGRPRKGEVTR